MRFTVSCLANAVTSVDVQKRDRLLEVDKGCPSSGIRRKQDLDEHKEARNCSTPVPLSICLAHYPDGAMGEIKKIIIITISCHFQADYPC